jgi:RNA polymerase sigma factor for flagellar operon FliA
VDAERLFLENLPQIDGVIRFVCRRNHLSESDAEEFAAHVRLKLIEGDYDILRKFEGRSLFSTYLTTVVQRLFSQQREQMWGKWRPSAEAKRLGDKAITLERMLTRDGFTFSESVAALTSGENPLFTRPEIEAIRLRLPPRQPRPVIVSDEAAQAVATNGTPATDLDGQSRNELARCAVRALDSLMAKLDAEDQLILRMRFWSCRKVVDIAGALGIDQKKLYKRIERLLASLRTELERAGVGREAIRDVLAHGSPDLALASWADDDGEGKTEPRHSHPPDGECGEGESRVG